MKGITGLRPETRNHLVVDEGIVFFNIDLQALEDDVASNPFDDAVSTAIRVGATRGGSSFNRGLTVRETEVDGKLGPTKGLQRRQEVRPTLTVNFQEMSVENLRNAMAGAVVATAGKFQRILGGEITDDAYIDNVALAATYSEQGVAGLPVLIVIENALALESPELATADQDEMVSEVTFAGHFTLDAPRVEPWRIYIPSTVGPMSV